MLSVLSGKPVAHLARLGGAYQCLQQLAATHLGTITSWRLRLPELTDPACTSVLTLPLLYCNSTTVSW